MAKNRITEDVVSVICEYEGVDDGVEVYYYHCSYQGHCEERCHFEDFENPGGDYAVEWGSCLRGCEGVGREV